MICVSAVTARHTEIAGTWYNQIKRQGLFTWKERRGIISNIKKEVWEFANKSRNNEKKNVFHLLVIKPNSKIMFQSTQKKNKKNQVTHERWLRMFDSVQLSFVTTAKISCLSSLASEKHLYHNTNKRTDSCMHSEG